MSSASDEELPPPPPSLPEDHPPALAMQMAEPPKRSPMARPGFGTSGAPIKLLSNHFPVKFDPRETTFFQYSVSIKYEDESEAEGKGIGRKVIDRLCQTYAAELQGKRFAYDGEKSLFTVGPLPQNRMEFTVVLEESSSRPVGDGTGGGGDQKRSKRTQRDRIFKVEINFAVKVPMKAITLAINGGESEQAQEALRVLDIIIRQQQVNRGCLLVRQSFFTGDIRNFADIGGGVTACRGLHSSFRATQGGLTLNMDVSSTMIVKPGPVVEFLIANQNVRNPLDIDWNRAKRMLKNLRIKATHNNIESKIIGLSDLPCNQQTFSLKVRDGGEDQYQEVTVLEYYKSRDIKLTWSANVPCLNVGRPKRPTYLPVELCDLVSLQRYTKALSSQQRASLVEKSRQKPQERIRVLMDAMADNRYGEDPLLYSTGISIQKQLVQVNGRVLKPPELRVGRDRSFVPDRGQWNYNQKTVFTPVKIQKWAIVNFSARCDLSHLSRDLMRCAQIKGLSIENPHTIIEEDHRWVREQASVRVDRMFEQLMQRLPGPPQFLLCVLPERKNSAIYGPWKKKNLHEQGIITQCLAPMKINDQYLTNVLLKINAKLGGMNSQLTVERARRIPFVSEAPTMILGMDVSHGSPGQSETPSIAAVVGSRGWPSISTYRASVRTQSPKVEMIDSLYKPSPDGGDDGMIRELLLDFYTSSNNRKPAQIIIFRDGVSESQFNQVLNIELNQIIQAYQHLGEGELPKFTVIIAQKNHHTKLFLSGSTDNVPPGTIVDTNIVHSRNYDFYMCAHAGRIGTSRPTHYHILLDEIGFAPDDLQNLVHALSYVYQRSTTAVSIVAPVSYAHLAAQQMSQFVKFDDLSETSSATRGVTSSGRCAVQELPRLHEKVCSSMFFC